MPLTFGDFQSIIARIYLTYPNGEPTNKIVGAGFLVSSRHLLTCAHVVYEALQLNSLEKPNQTICLDFPNRERNEVIKTKANVSLWQPCPKYLESKLTEVRVGEDVALLRLQKPLTGFKPVPLKVISDVRNHPFATFGFPDYSQGGIETDGSIRAYQGVSGWYQLQVNLNRPNIVGGFSGAPLWCDYAHEQAIIGMTVAANKKVNQGKSAYAIEGITLEEIWCQQGHLIEILELIDWDIIQRAYQRSQEQLQTDWPQGQPKDCASLISDLYKIEKQFGHKQQRLTLLIHILDDIKDDLLEFTNLDKLLKKRECLISELQESILILQKTISSLQEDFQAQTHRYEQEKQLWNERQSGFSSTIDRLTFEVNAQKSNHNQEIQSLETQKNALEAMLRELRNNSQNLENQRCQHKEQEQRWVQANSNLIEKARELNSKLEKQINRHRTEKQEWLDKQYSLKRAVQKKELYQLELEEKLEEQNRKYDVEKQSWENERVDLTRRVEELEHELQSRRELDSIYLSLEHALEKRNWKRADQETHKILMQAVDNFVVAMDIVLTEDEIERLPCGILKQIDDLWRNYSQEEFGFKVQLNTYLSTIISSNHKDEEFDSFCRKIGWRGRGSCTSFPKGYFPSYLHFAEDEDPYCPRLHKKFRKVLSKFSLAE